MKYKIQMEGAWGWGDFKSSNDRGEYEVDLYDTEEDAKKELESIFDSFGRGSADEYRIVGEDVAEETNLY
jgi:hypothetical protein